MIVRGSFNKLFDPKLKEKLLERIYPGKLWREETSVQHEEPEEWPPKPDNLKEKWWEK